MLKERRLPKKAAKEGLQKSLKKRGGTRGNDIVGGANSLGKEAGGEGAKKRENKKRDWKMLGNYSRENAKFTRAGAQKPRGKRGTVTECRRGKLPENDSGERTKSKGSKTSSSPGKEINSRKEKGK